MSKERLIIIGAGPKAMAVAAKATVLGELGFRVPEIQIVERHKVGAHWTGESGHTNGLLRLSTSPEKDIGFPYDSTCWADEDVSRIVNTKMMRFSWQAFLVQLNLYSDWIDRGRPAPEHRRWAQYLQWVSDQIGENAAIHYAEVDRISIDAGKWTVLCRLPNGQSMTLHADGLMMTGPGRTSASVDAPRHDDRVLTIEEFWTNPTRFRSIGKVRIAVVGTGESAAAITTELAQHGDPALRIDVISPLGMTYSRGESFLENRLFSDPESGRWQQLSKHDRRSFIHRTDRGVFSMAAQLALNAEENVDVLPGRLRRVVTGSDGQLELELDYNQGLWRHPYDFVILAMGYDHLSMIRKMLDERSLRQILQQTGLHELTDGSVEPLIEQHFEVHGLQPRLHLPMLARLQQGPGFANLSCLGRLSDLLLSAYVWQDERQSHWPVKAVRQPEIRWIQQALPASPR